MLTRSRGRRAANVRPWCDRRRSGDAASGSGERGRHLPCAMPAGSLRALHGHRGTHARAAGRVRATLE
ncbi:conserved hypothetical protein [Burkholderia multivorans CGD1]|nr:conserved hypothetical protein [Burkholderia multivorans CGD1]